MDLSALPLGGLTLSRLVYIPGKMLSVQLQGIAEGKDGGHASAEYQAQFSRPSDVHIELICAPVARLRKVYPVETFGSTSGSGQHVRIVLEAGAIELNARDSSCAELRYDKFTDADEQGYRST